MLLAVAIFGRNNGLLYFRCAPSALPLSTQLQQLAYASMDVLDERERLPSNKTQELFQGCLLLNNSFKSMGYTSNTQTRFVLIYDAADISIRDQDVRSHQMNVGGVVKIADVSDFIAPSQACVLPLPETSKSCDALVKLRTRVPKPVPEAKVTVSLKDCLACSGCVTTAETVLVQSQTVDEALKGLAESSHSVVSLSPQSLASLAVELNLTLSEACIRVTQFFKSRGANFVVDSSFGRYFSLMASWDEVRHRLQSEGPRTTLVSGICPGFVCYAEKRKGGGVVPYISNVRSPQGMMGALVKDYLTRLMRWEPSKVFHVTLMPCYDKKLEASRRDLVVQGTDVRQTDCVITPTELLPLLKLYEPSPAHPAPESLTWLNSLEHGQVIGDFAGQGSGGYAQFIADRMQHELKATPESFDSRLDLEKVTLKWKGNRVLTIGTAFGFRNIQNLVRRLNRGQHELDYVEVMACPRGCINGGGQMRDTEPAVHERRVQEVAESYGAATDRALLEAEFQRVRQEWQDLNPDYRALLAMEMKQVEAPPPNSVSAMSW